MRTLATQSPRRRLQRGVAAVEFAIVALGFFVLVFGTIELARVIYMYNTLADVTRSAARSAANIDWRETTQMNKAMQRAVFRDTPGVLPFGAPITDRHIRIDYLYLQRQSDGSLSMQPVATMPSCPGRNRHNCLANPYGSGSSAGDACIRLVRARICRPDAAGCERMNYQMLMPMLRLYVPLPTSTTVVSAETLGFHPGDSVCP